MRPTQQLHDAGQSLWLDSISRELLDGGGLERHIREHSVTGLTSNPSLFEQAIGGGTDYDAAIRKASRGRPASAAQAETIAFDLALDDLQRAADLFRPTFEETHGVDGWVSLEVSPELAHDSKGSIEAARDLHARAMRPNLFIKIPGTREGSEAIEELIFAGVPINVTLLFSREHYLAAAEAWLAGIERRVAAHLDPRVASVASLFVSRWDKAVAERAPPELRNRLGLAIAARTYKAYRDLLASDRWLRLLNVGASAQRLLWGSTGTKDPAASDLLYVAPLAAPHTINTMPEKTLLALDDHGRIGPMMPADGGIAESTLAAFVKAGIDIDALAEQLQREGTLAFDKSWEALLARITAKSAAVQPAH